jgi:hypothetical protein
LFTGMKVLLGTNNGEVSCIDTYYVMVFDNFFNECLNV